VTAGPSPNNIGFVTLRAAKMLTKRRAVDFCHVATAICPPPAALIPDLAAPRSAEAGARGSPGGAAAADDEAVWWRGA